MPLVSSSAGGGGTASDIGQSVGNIELSGDWHLFPTSMETLFSWLLVALALKSWHLTCSRLVVGNLIVDGSLVSSFVPLVCKAFGSFFPNSITSLWSTEQWKFSALRFFSGALEPHLPFAFVTSSISSLLCELWASFGLFSNCRLSCLCLL